MKFTKITEQDHLIAQLLKNPETGETMIVISLENHPQEHAWIMEASGVSVLFAKGAVRIPHAINEPEAPKIQIVGANHLPLK